MVRVRRGMTLLEVLIGTSLTLIITVVIGVAFEQCCSVWHTLDARSAAEAGQRILLSDMRQELHRASAGSIGMYAPPDDSRWALWMKSPMNDTDNLNVLGASSVLQVAGDKLDPQRYVLYYVAHLDAAEHHQDYGMDCTTTTTAPDGLCPHKLVVREDILLRDATGTDTLGTQSTFTIATLGRFLLDGQTTAALNSLPNTQPLVRRVQIMAREVLSFELTRLQPGLSETASPSGPVILVDVKMLNLGEIVRTLAVGQNPEVKIAVVAGGNGVQVATPAGDDFAHSASTVVPQYQPYLVDVDERASRQAIVERQYGHSDRTLPPTAGSARTPS